jgi:hypothetical protein
MEIYQQRWEIVRFKMAMRIQMYWDKRITELYNEMFLPVIDEDVKPDFVVES